MARREIQKTAIQLRFGHVTGKEAYRRLGIMSQRLYMRPTYAIRVVLVHAPHVKRGYIVKTAFPVNGELRGRIEIRIPIL